MTEPAAPVNWGTILHYAQVQAEPGPGIDVACRFVPDDGGKPVPLIWRNVCGDSVPLRLGNGARATYDAGHGYLSVKALPEQVAKAEALIARINASEPAKRALMHADDNGLYTACGYVWSSDHKLIRMTPRQQEDRK